MQHLLDRTDLFALKIDANAALTHCRSIPFMAAPTASRGATTRRITSDTETIPVGARAETLFLLGLINEGWEHGAAMSPEHPELMEKRTDQVFIGSRIGEIEIRYAGGFSDRIPLIIGATAWFAEHWAVIVPRSDGSPLPPIQEPFTSRPELMDVVRRSLRLREHLEPTDPKNAHTVYFLAITPRDLEIEALVVHDNPNLRGRPLISAVTLAGAQLAPTLEPFGHVTVDPADLEPSFSASDIPDFAPDLEALARVLYNREEDLPNPVQPVELPAELDAARVRFIGGNLGVMLTNIWNANLSLMDEKFEADTGIFRESGLDFPWYNGYQGIGAWTSHGAYYGAIFSRTSEHYATLAMRCLPNRGRCTNYVDYVDRCLYFYRTNHDPDKGPDNAKLDIDRYPKDAPPHWSFVMNSPLFAPQINELPGNEEMDGHGSTVIGRWAAWRQLGCPVDDWLKASRPDVYGKSRWDSTRDAAEFICWLMDYTGRDVIYSESELTGWGAGLVPEGMATETDPVKIRANYANANMYEVYPTQACSIALRCAAQMAEAANEPELAVRWRTYADRIQAGMLRLLRVGDITAPEWRVSFNSVLPSLMDCLAPAFLSQYCDGLNPNGWDKEMSRTTRNTLRRQLAQRSGHAPVLFMGYGIGWLTHSAIILDEMDDASKLLSNIAKYSYDKNMDYADEQRGIDWRKWAWIVPEGVNLLPDGSWYRLSDLSNGANQGPVMHALEACLGIDDADPAHIKILSRLPQPLEALEVDNFAVVIAHEGKTELACLSYTWRPGISFELRSDRPLPTLDLRLGPFKDEASAILVQGRLESENAAVSGATFVLDYSGHITKGEEAIWLWIMGMREIISLQLDLGNGG